MKDQVFQQQMPSDIITFADIMKELIGIKVRQDLQEKNQSRSRSDDQDWRFPDSQKRPTLEDYKAWESQRQNQSPRSQN